MNLFTGARFAENVKRLALGLEPLDAGRGGRIPHPVRVVVPGSLTGLPRPRVDRHASCLHALLYQPSVADSIDIRFEDEERRYVPRQFRYPILTVDAAEVLDYRNRVRRPVLFPGAAYDAVSMATGIRGRVTRAAGGQVVRWSRVEARLAAGGEVLARAHGDDRGEFLLLLPPTGSEAELVDPLPLRIDVFGVAAAPAPATPDLPGQDPCWDLPTEAAAALDPNNPAADDVSAGATLPAGYTATAGRTVDVPLGTILSLPDVFAIS
ncbi:MAG: hypothetical protein IT162_19270 [Bryobacterales bacterium]|nr:hypothetical protein [Bryobacterales bacterium]